MFESELRVLIDGLIETIWRYCVRFVSLEAIARDRGVSRECRDKALAAVMALCEGLAAGVKQETMIGTIAEMVEGLRKILVEFESTPELRVVLEAKITRLIRISGVPSPSQEAISLSAQVPGRITRPVDVLDDGWSNR